MTLDMQRRALLGLQNTRPMSSGRSPVELRVGSTGAGVFVGCGAGLGIITPISLYSIPVLGQLAASLATSLGSLNAASGGIFAAARSRVRALGIRHLDLGFGCGVMVGYGYGAGLMLSPTAQQSLSHGLQAAGQQLLARLPQPLQAALQQQRHGPAGAWAAGSTAGGLATGGLSSWQDPALPQQQQQQEGNHHRDLGMPSQHPEGSSRSSTTTSSLSSSERQQHDQHWQRRPTGSQDADEMAELTRLVLKQQNQLGDLREQVQALQVTVCKLDPSAPGCKAKA